MGQSGIISRLLPLVEAKEKVAVDRSLLINLDDVVQHPGRTAEIEISTATLEDPDIALSKPISGVLEARMDGSVLHLSGEFTATLVLECDRCGSDVEMEFPFEVEEFFPINGNPSGLAKGEYARVDDSEEPFPLFEEGNKLRVEDLLRQDLISELPMHVYCSENCLGLCERCGKNLNDGPCGCEPEVGHPAFQGLSNVWQDEGKS